MVLYVTKTINPIRRYQWSLGYDSDPTMFTGFSFTLLGSRVAARRARNRYAKFLMKERSKFIHKEVI